MENDVVTTGGKMAGQFPERLAAAGNLDRIETVLKASREKGIPVIYVVAGMRPGYPDMPGALSPLAGLVVKMGAMVRGTWGAEINEKVKPLKGEVLIYNFGPSGFWHTDLDLILRSKGIKNVVLTGVATNFVVESTARDAAMLGYYFYVLKDCTNSLRDDLHNFSLTNILPMLGAVTDSKTFIEALGKAR
jgi:nicotinamidase-related amidase